MYFLRKLADDLVNLLRPSFADKSFPLNCSVGEYMYTIPFLIGNFLFFRTEIADTHLNERRNLRQVQCVVHDGCVGISKAFVGDTQVLMRIDVQNTKRLMTLGLSTEITQWSGVVATDESDELAGIHPMANLLFHPMVHAFTSGIDFSL